MGDKHIHVWLGKGRARANDEVKHDPKNGQFSSGGEVSSKKKKKIPAVAAKRSNRGAAALHQMQAASAKHLAASGKGHLNKSVAQHRTEAEKSK